MPGRPFRRYCAVAVLGLWLAPGAGALALGLHVAHDHGSGHYGAPGHASALLDELMAAVTHGHHHRAAAPHHEHPAHVDAAPGLSPSPSPTAAVPAGPRGATDDGHGEVDPLQRRRAPPVPLFHAHCSLLL
jgi:hypothetical protein